MAASIYQPLDYDEAAYSRLPIDRVAFRRLAENPVPEAAFDALRAVFLKHDLHTTLALGVIHRHFDLAPGERLVEYRSVLTPWSISHAPAYARPGLRAKNWALIDNELRPYEYRYHHVNAPADIAFPLAFVDDLRAVLAAWDLADVYGLARLEADDFDMTTPPRLEFTAGRANVLVPFTEELRDVVFEESAWVFACVDPVQGSLGRVEDGEAEGGPRKRYCAITCEAHKDP